MSTNLLSRHQSEFSIESQHNNDESNRWKGRVRNEFFFKFITIYKIYLNSSRVNNFQYELCWSCLISDCEWSFFCLREHIIHSTLYFNRTSKEPNSFVPRPSRMCNLLSSYVFPITPLRWGIRFYTNTIYVQHNAKKKLETSIDLRLTGVY